MARVCALQKAALVLEEYPNRVPSVRFEFRTPFLGEALSPIKCDGQSALTGHIQPKQGTLLDPSAFSLSDRTQAMVLSNFVAMTVPSSSMVQSWANQDPGRSMHWQ